MAGSEKPTAAEEECAVIPENLCVDLHAHLPTKTSSADRDRPTAACLDSYESSSSKDSTNHDLAILENQGMPKSMPCAHENDTDLAYLNQIWPTLLDNTKAQIIDLIRQHGGDHE